MPAIIIVSRNLMNILLNVAEMDIPDFPTSETSEHDVSTPTLVANPLPPPTRVHKNRSEA